MTPQKAQMAQKDSLDDAIDQVTARLTHVDDDPVLASRIVAALPERANWFGWLFHSWVPRLAMIAIVVTAGLMWASRATPIAVDPSPIVAAPNVVAPTVVAMNLEPVRTKPLERLERLEPLEPARADHERSLAAVAALAPLDVESLTPKALPAEASIEIASLAIVSLPLTDEFPER